MNKIYLVQTLHFDGENRYINSVLAFSKKEDAAKFVDSANNFFEYLHEHAKYDHNHQCINYNELYELIEENIEQMPDKDMQESLINDTIDMLNVSYSLKEIEVR